MRADPGFYRTRDAPIVRGAEQHARGAPIAHEARGDLRDALRNPLLGIAVRRAGREGDRAGGRA